MILDGQYLNTGIHLLRYMMYPVPEFVNLVIFFFKEMNEWGKLILTMKKKIRKANGTILGEYTGMSTD